MNNAFAAAAAVSIAFAPFSSVVLPGLAHAWTCEEMRLPAHSIAQCESLPPAAQEGLLQSVCDYEHLCGGGGGAPAAQPAALPPPPKIAPPPPAAQPAALPPPPKIAPPPPAAPPPAPPGAPPPPPAAPAPPPAAAPIAGATSSGTDGVAANCIAGSAYAAQYSFFCADVGIRQPGAADTPAMPAAAPPAPAPAAPPPVAPVPAVIAPAPDNPLPNGPGPAGTPGDRCSQYSAPDEAAAHAMCEQAVADGGQ